jgi:hypothetical protein
MKFKILHYFTDVAINSFLRPGNIPEKFRASGNGKI